MIRRSFLGFLGGAVTAGPRAVASAAAPIANMAKLSLGDVSDYASDLHGAQKEVGGPSQGDSIGYAMRRLKEMTGLSAEAAAREQREFYIGALHPDVAGLRSVSIGTKLKMTRRMAYEQSVRNRKTYFQGIIDGLWE